MKQSIAKSEALLTLLIVVSGFLASAADAQAEPPFAEKLLPGSAFAGVVPGPNGRLYGVTYNGGASNKGTLYSVDPVLSPWVTHHSFSGIDGEVPYDELVFDPASRKFYGTTSQGGPSGAGTVFAFDPVSETLTTLASEFNGFFQPQGPLVISNGFVYGTLARTTGAIFRMAINGTGFTVLHEFSEVSSLPQSLTLGQDGVLYGVTIYGGIHCDQTAPSRGCGTIFRANPVLPGDSNVQFQTIYQFQWGAPVSRNNYPQRKLVYGSDGILYGATFYSIFHIDPHNVTPASTFQFIWQEGGGVSLSITEGVDNRIYAAYYGGGAEGAGKVFSLAKDGTNVLTIRTFTFSSGLKAYGPYGMLFRTAAGDIYGTTEYTGSPAPYRGTVFRIRDRFLSSNQYILSGSADGNAPIIVDDDLDIYQNGGLIRSDGSEPAGFRFPIRITVNPGDVLRFVVRDTYRVCAALGPIYLTDFRGVGILADPGFSLGCGRGPNDPELVHDYLFTVGSVKPGAPSDFDGDGRTDISIFRPSLGQWWLNRSSLGVAAFTFGNSADRIAQSDFTGDGITDVAIFRPSSGEWFILRSEDSTFYSFPFGLSGDIPVPSNYDGDTKADAAVFRPTNSTWYIQNSGGGTTVEAFGAAGDFPAPADFDGDGLVDIAVFRPDSGQWWLKRSSLGVIAVTFGGSTDRNVQGDYTGDGIADVAFWRPQTGEWFILRSEDFTYYSFPFGTNGDSPAPGDYDGDGKRDAAVFRPSNSTWYVQRSTAGTMIQGFGLSSDLAVPSAVVRP